MSAPEPIRLHAPELSRDDKSVTVRFPIDVGGDHDPVFYRILDPTVEPAHLGEVMVATALFLAMAEGRPLECELEVDPQFLSGCQRLQEIFHRWMPELTPVALSAPARDPEPGKSSPAWRAAEAGAAVLFSGGVDSFHSALDLQAQLRTAIYIHGFDTELSDVGYREKIARELRAATEAIGMQLIEVETNLRDISDDFCTWYKYHGAMIAAVSHLLSAPFERLYVPSSYTYDQLSQCGSDPLLDHHWSSGDLLFVHHAASVSRMEKIEAIADSELARRHLRVCWENVDEAYNCGRCEKCMRTILNLKVLGKEETFRGLFGYWPEPAEIVPHLCIDSESPQIFFNNILVGARRYGVGEELMRELEEVRKQVAAYHLTKDVARLSAEGDADYFASGEWRDHLLPKVRRELWDGPLLDDPEWLIANCGLGRDELFEILWQRDRRVLEAAAKDDVA